MIVKDNKKPEALVWLVEVMRATSRANTIVESAANTFIRGD